MEADRLCPEPRPPQIDPGGKTALRVDVEYCHPRSLPRPNDRQLSGERRLAGAALALRDRDHQARHSPPYAKVRRVRAGLSSGYSAAASLLVNPRRSATPRP